MPTEADFLAAVIADPDDDAPRLIYADWLDENGQDERAEFIKAQVAIARTIPTDHTRRAPEEGCPCLFCALRRREGELLDRHWTEWAADLRAGYCLNLYTGTPLSPPNRAILFRRGFVHAVTCAAADWLAHGDAVLAAQPVREVRLTTYPTTAQLATMDIRWGDASQMFTGLVRDTFAFRWPSVKVWHLPPADAGVLTPNELRALRGRRTYHQGAHS